MALYCIGVNLSRLESGTKSMKKWDIPKFDAEKQIKYYNLEVPKNGTWPIKKG